jgi:pyrimidine-nucleoside phosphorylase
MLMDLRKEVGMIRHPQLVVASILGKKLATNCGKLVIEVKNGIESKMHFPGVPPNVATEYGAQLFLEVGKNLGMEIICLITDGNRPQGKFIGNKIALLEVISILQGKTNTTVVSNSLFELAKQTSLEMLKLADKTLSELNIMTEIEKVIRNLKAFELFIAQMKEHGAIEIEDLNRNGDKLIKEIEKLLPDSDRRTVIALKTGVITKIDVTTVDDAAKLLIVENGKIIDYEAGIVLHKQVGEKVQKKDILATICGNDDKHFKRIIEMLSTTIVIEEEAKVEKSDLVSKFAWKLGKSKEILITDWKNGNWQERVKFPL